MLSALIFSIFTSQKQNPMKTILLSLTVFLFTSSLLRAQAVPALSLQNGKYLVSVSRETPSVTVISAEELAGATGLMLVDLPTMKPESSEIVSFSMTIITEEGKNTLESEEGTLTPHMKEQLQQLRSGVKIHFENINCKQVDGAIMTLPSMLFEIL